jgi:hypothetical protein
MTTLPNKPGPCQGITVAEHRRRKKVVEDYRHSVEAFEHFGAGDLEPARRLADELGFANITVEAGSMPQRTEAQEDALDDIADRLINAYLAGELTPARRRSILADIDCVFGDAVN